MVLLDEPTSGLDPASARHVRDLILALRKEGRAVLVSTHNLAEAEELADRIAVLKTELLAFDSPAALRSRGAGIAVAIEFEDGSKQTTNFVTCPRFPNRWTPRPRREANRAGQCPISDRSKTSTCRWWERRHERLRQGSGARQGGDGFRRWRKRMRAS